MTMGEKRGLPFVARWNQVNRLARGTFRRAGAGSQPAFACALGGRKEKALFQRGWFRQGHEKILKDGGGEGNSGPDGSTVAIG